jgi:hypothetical protein
MPRRAGPNRGDHAARSPAAAGRRAVASAARSPCPLIRRKRAPRGRAQHAQPDPAADHRAVAPALDVPGHVPQRPDEILDRVRRREEPPQPGRQLQLEDREGLLQALPQTRRGVGVAIVLEPPHQAPQLASRRVGAGGAIGPADGVQAA